MSEYESIVAQFSKKDKAKFWHRVDMKLPDECWVWKGCTLSGRGVFARQGKTIGAHVVAHLLSGGELPNGHIVRHVACRNAICCNPAHLTNGTHKDNAADRDRDGMTARGERNGAFKVVKLSADDVREIRRLYDETHMSHLDIGNMFGVSGSCIGNIVIRKSWKHVE
jgi:hypothetical protein